MAQASWTEQKAEEPHSLAKRRLREGALLLLIAVVAYLMLSLLTYSAGDPGWSYSGPRAMQLTPVGLWARGFPMYSSTSSDFSVIFFPSWWDGWGGWH